MTGIARPGRVQPEEQVESTSRGPLGWAEARRVLVVRLDGAGDALMTAPAIEALRGAVEGRRITLLTSAAGARLARLLPAVDDVIEYAAPWMPSMPSMKVARSSDAAPDLDMIARLRGQFDAAVICTVYSQSPLPAALLCTLAEVPLRAAIARENPYGLLSDWIRETEPDSHVRHEVDRQLALASALGAPGGPSVRLAIPEAARTAARGWLHARGLERGGPWALLHPGATAASRRYPSEMWSEVVRGLESSGVRVLLVGDSGDRDALAVVGAASEESPPSIVAPSLADLAALIEAAPLVLAVNSLPAHLASATGTPLVELYAQTNPQHGPWNDVPHRLLARQVPCGNCYRSVCPLGHHACMRELAPLDVVTAALDLLRERSGSRASSPD